MAIQIASKISLWVFLGHILNHTLVQMKPNWPRFDILGLALVLTENHVARRTVPKYWSVIRCFPSIATSTWFDTYRTWRGRTYQVIYPILCINISAAAHRNQWGTLSHNSRFTLQLLAITWSPRAHARRWQHQPLTLEPTNRHRSHQYSSI